MKAEWNPGTNMITGGWEICLHIYMGGRLPLFYGISVKTNFQNQNFFVFFFFFFLLFFNIYSLCDSTTFALRHTQISLSGILRHFRPPSRHLLLHTHDTNMEFLQLSETTRARKIDPCSIFFCFPVKPKFVTPTHAYIFVWCISTNLSGLCKINVFCLFVFVCVFLWCVFYET